MAPQNLTNFKNLHATIKDEDPCTMFFTTMVGRWWFYSRGFPIEDLTTMLGLTQLRNQLTLNQTKIPLALTLFLLTNTILYLKVEHVLPWTPIVTTK